tara:strand:+ start:242 stop:373 length:132 start_codon:yes stop_codon:yes gene_type:complete
MADLDRLRGLVRRFNNIAFGYKKPTGRRKSENKPKKNTATKHK